MYTVYIITENGNVRYVGKTRNFKRRVREHKYSKKSFRSALPSNVDMSCIKFIPVYKNSDESKALKFEDWLIREYDTIRTGWNNQRSGYVYKDNPSGYMYEYLKKREKTEKRIIWRREYLLRKKHEKNIVII